jgi:C-terminal processing protease CtpA/Prc
MSVHSLVGTVNTQFYDNTGGAFFSPRDFYGQWKLFRRVADGADVGTIKPGMIPDDIHLDTREGAVRGMKWLIGSINDPFSKYLTREELAEELHEDATGFLGTGAVVETPHQHSAREFSSFYGPQQLVSFNPTETLASLAMTKKNDHSQKKVLSITRAGNLPVVTAVAPDSPAERAGLVVGDRIVGVGDQDFLGWTRAEIGKQLATKYNQKTYFGQADLSVARPIYGVPSPAPDNFQVLAAMPSVDSTLSADVVASRRFPSQEVILGYRQTKLRLPIPGMYEPSLGIRDASFPNPAIVGGDSIVHYQLLTSQSGSIFDLSHSDNAIPVDYKVGYIRLTRFSKASTAGYLQAIQALEDAGARSYIFDLRNNYGGVIQEAMLTASTLLRDPHAVLCYTMNARGGFTPHDAEEYIVDRRYPGYLLSTEPRTSTMDQVQKENPAMFVANGIAWDPPSSYASLHEQVTKRGIRRISYMNDLDSILESNPKLKAQFKAQKKIVVLINEGTASAAEVFVAALHDNARTTAVIGTKSYGKGLIQHTFPMPDGGGLRLTVAEYLTPSLSHVTTVGGARYDPLTGEFIGGGIRPDIVCESKQGIPGNIRADLCVGVALDVLEETASAEDDEGFKWTTPVQGLIANIPSQLLGHRPQSK